MEKLKLLLQMVKLHMKNYNIVFVKLFNNELFLEAINSKKSKVKTLTK